MKIWDKARMPEDPVKPRKSLIVLVAAMLGLMVGAQLAILVEGADTSVRTPAELWEAAHLSVAVAIPHVREAEARERRLSATFHQGHPRPRRSRHSVPVFYSVMPQRRNWRQPLAGLAGSESVDSASSRRRYLPQATCR